MNFYPFHIGDYASATRHLTWMEDAAYRRLLDVYYVKESPLPIDKRQIYRLVVASDEEQRTAVDVVLEEFFALTDEGYTHARCDAEIHAMNEKKNKASQSAQTRWRNANCNNVALPSDNGRNANASDNPCERITDAQKPICEGNAPNPNPNPNKKQVHIKPASPYGFAEFWAAYPKKVGKGAAEKAWKNQRPSLDDVLPAIRRQEATDQWKRDGGQFIPNPATWLNQRRWEDGVPLLSVVADARPEFMRGAL